MSSSPERLQTEMLDILQRVGRTINTLTELDPKSSTPGRVRMLKREMSGVHSKLATLLSQSKKVKSKKPEN